MANTSIIDFRHLLDPRGRIRARPTAIARRAAHVAAIVEIATAWPAGNTLESAFGCRRRPGHRPCRGRLYLRRSEVPAAIVWICPLCGDRGMVQHFARTRWDLSLLEVLPHEASLALSRREYETLFKAETDLERRALLARATPERERVLVQGAQSQLAALRARVAVEHGPQDSAGRGSRRKRVLKLRITLRDVRPPVWRCVEIPSTTTLGQLHRVVQVAMGWTDSHLHRFRQGDVHYGIPNREDERPPLHERRVRVADLLAKRGDRMLYDYDLGDGWIHEIRLDEVAPAQRDARYPRCLKGKRACPPENVGGPWGYAEMLAGQPAGDAAVIPARPLRQVRFDPDAFDLEQVNNALRRLKL